MRKEKEMDFTVSFVPMVRGIIIAWSASHRLRLPSAPERSHATNAAAL